MRILKKQDLHFIGGGKVTEIYSATRTEFETLLYIIDEDFNRDSPYIIQIICYDLKGPFILQLNQSSRLSSEKMISMGWTRIL